MRTDDTETERSVNQLTNSELIIGLAYAVGTDIKNVIKLLSDQLSRFGYESEVIKITDRTYISSRNTKLCFSIWPRQQIDGQGKRT